MIKNSWKEFHFMLQSYGNCKHDIQWTFLPFISWSSLRKQQQVKYGLTVLVCVILLWIASWIAYVCTETYIWFLLPLHINGKTTVETFIIIIRKHFVAKSKNLYKKNENCTAGCIVHKGVHISREEKENTWIVD